MAGQISFTQLIYDSSANLFAGCVSDNQNKIESDKLVLSYDYSIDGIAYFTLTDK